MHILILDDDKSYGALLASACKKLGHRAQLRVDPGAALSLLQEESFDVVLVDLEMPESPGPMVARWLRSHGYHLPIAFCTGTCQDESLIASAGDLGKVLPRVWTHADLKVILDALESEQRELTRQRQSSQDEIDMSRPGFARGTGPGAARFEDQPTEDIVGVATHDPGDTIRTLPIVDDTQPIQERPIFDEFPSDQTMDRASLHGEMTPGLASAIGEMRRNLPRLQIVCATWSLVQRLCDDLEHKQRMITVHADQNLRIGDDVMVGITLPDEMVVAIGGRVRDVREGGEARKRTFAIELTDFGPQEAAYLSEACALYAAPEAEARPMMDTNPRIPVTRDSVDLDEGAYEGEARISWGKPSR